MVIRFPVFSFIALAAGIAVAALEACSGENGDSAADDGGADASITDGAGIGDGAPISDAARDAEASDDGPDGRSASLDGGCNPVVTQTHQVPLDIYVMVDRASAMSRPLGDGGTIGDALRGALDAFVGSPQQGVAVGLQYFGLPPGGPGGTCVDGASCQTSSDCHGGVCPDAGACVCVGGDSCNAADYEVPAVGIAPLPGSASAISASLAANAPSASPFVPTAAALGGAIEYAANWSRAHAGDRTIVVLVMGGEPSECTPSDDPALGQIAAAGAAGTPSVATFVVGLAVDAGTGTPSAIAQGSGTVAVFVEGTPNAQQKLGDALAAIRRSATACTYAIPVPDLAALDPSKLNVQIVSGAGALPQLVPKVADASHCPPDGGAWHYDREPVPTQIVLCQSTCAALTIAPSAIVDVLFGCETQPL